MFTLIVFGVLFFIIYTVYVSPDNSNGNKGTNNYTIKDNYGSSNQNYNSNGVNNTTPRAMPNFHPKFENDIIVPDNTKRKAQKVSTQKNDSAVISVDQQADIYRGASKAPSSLGTISDGARPSSKIVTAADKAKEEQAIKDRELEAKVEKAKERANKILGNNQ